MSTNEKLRVLILITSPKTVQKARELFSAEGFPFLYQTHAKGTASSEVMDILGLGSAEKRMIVCLAEKSAADAMLLKLHKALRMGSVNSGIAFTLPLSAASKIVFRTLIPSAETEERKGDKTVSEKKNVMIAAVVNLGYSEDVMIAARAAGAGGGTVLHSRSLSEDDVQKFGTGMTEEKDIVLIVSGPDNKSAVMNAISEKCGIRSEAKGIVFSLPIDNVIGLSDD